MKKILLLLFSSLIYVCAYSQVTYFEKSFQDDWLQFNRKFFKTSDGVLTYFSHKGNSNGPFLSGSKLYKINNFGENIIKKDIPFHIEDAEVISIIDFQETSDGQILAVTNQMGCDYLLSNPFSLVKISIDGEFTLLKNYEESFYPSGLIKYGTGFIFYHTQFSNNSYFTSWEYINENLEFYPLSSLLNMNLLKIFSNENNQLFAIEEINQNSIRVSQIDTLGNTIYQSEVIEISDYFSIYETSILTVDSLVYITNNKSLVKTNTHLDDIQVKNYNFQINGLSNDFSGSIYLLADNHNLIKIDTSSNEISNVNLNSLTSLIETVEWISIDKQSNILYYAGNLNNYPFVKNASLNDFSNTQNTISTQIEEINISNSIAYVSSGNMNSIISYEFDVAATIKNIGNVTIDNLFLNCSKQIGYYFCGPPYLSKRFANLNLSPGETTTLNIGKYFDYNVFGPPAITSYNRDNFCVWSTNHNGSWSYFDDTFCDQVLITNIVNSVSKINSELIKSIYPNPANELINLELNINSDILKYRIGDVNGRIIMEAQVFEKDKLTINISSLINGFYIIELIGKNNISKAKFLKK